MYFFSINHARCSNFDFSLPNKSNALIILKIHQKAFRNRAILFQYKRPLFQNFEFFSQINLILQFPQFWHKFHLWIFAWIASFHSKPSWSEMPSGYTSSNWTFSSACLPAWGLSLPAKCPISLSSLFQKGVAFRLSSKCHECRLLQSIIFIFIFPL